MTQEMIVAKGMFSTLTITLSDEVLDNLAYKIDPKDNPLKAVEDELKAIIPKFERLYFDAVNPVEAPTQETE